MKEKYGDQQQQEGGKQNLFGKKQDIEPKIGGFSLQGASATTKLLYLGVVAAVLLGSLFYGKNIKYIRIKIIVSIDYLFMKQWKEKERNTIYMCSKNFYKESPLCVMGTLL